MIKIFSNQTNVPKITVESKFLKNKTTFLTPNAENGLVEKVKSDTLLFVKVQVSGLESGESIGKIQLALAYIETSMNYRLKVIQCPKITLTESYMKEFARNLTGNEEVAETRVIYGSTQSKPVTEQKEVKYVTFDLTNLNKLYFGKNLVFMFVIKNDSENNFLNLFDPEYVAGQVACCNATLTNFGGLNGMYKFDKHQVEGTGTGYVNLYNRKLIHIVDGLTSLSKKMPITYSTIHNYGKSNEKSFLAKELTPSFQYKIFKSGEEYVIEDPTGNRNYYAYVDQEKEEGKKTISTYGIKHLDTTGDLYFCNIDNSYFYLESTDTKETITLFDQQDNQITFEVMLNVENILLGRFTKIMSRETKFGDCINYIWNGTNLEKITNSDGEEVLFSYDLSNRIIKVDFTSLKQYIQYTYTLNEWRIDIAIYSYELSSKTEPELTKLKEVELNYTQINRGNYQELLLSSVVDKIIHQQINYVNDGTIQSVSVTNLQGEKAYQVNYANNSYCTTLTSFDGKKHFYYFDNYGRCKLEMDNQGRSITYNYDEFEHGESKHLTSVSNVQTNSRNLLENHSFEDEDNLFKDESLGWKKTGDTNSLIKTKVGGVYGEKYLYIDKVANETITISQDIISPEAGKITLKGFMKHQVQNETEEIADGSIKVKVSGTYTRVEDVIVRVDSTTTATETRPVNHYLNKELTFSGNSDWQPFSLSTTLPTDAYDITMKVEIIVSGVASEVGIDDLQLCASKPKTRYNLIENGYMEFTENNLPKGWNFANKEAEDVIMEISSSDEHPVILGKKVMQFKQGDVDKELNSANFKIKKMYKEIPIHGLAGEQLVFSVFAKAFASSGNILRSYLKIYHTNEQYRSYTFDFDKNFKNWQMLTRAVSAEYDFNKVEVGVEYSGGKEALFDCFQLYKDSYGKYYNYDERGNITEVISDDGNAMRINYDENNQIKEIFTQDGSSFKYNYDTKGRLEKVTDLSGNVVTIIYDTNDYVIQTTITTVDGETIINKQERDKWGEITKAIDEHENTTIMGYNYLNQIAQINQANGLLESFNYNQDFTLKSLNAVVESKIHKNSFTYDEAKQVKCVESANGTKYNFTYDSFGRLTKIDVNGEIINQFTYNETINNINKGLVSCKQYGTSGDYFHFTYNEDHQIEEVKLNGESIVEYEYNEEGQISQVKDSRNNTIKYFTYDLRGKLIKVVDNENQSISYTYDNLHHLQKTSYQMGAFEKSFDYEYDYETNEYTKEGYFNRIEKVFCDEVVKGGMGTKGTYGAKPVLKTIEQVYDDSIKMKVYQFEDTYDFIWYKLDTFNINRQTGYSNGKYFNLDTWKRRFFYNKTFYMWIKPSGTFKEENLFRFQKEDTSQQRTNLAILNILSNGRIGYREETKNYYSNISTSILKQNEWNLVGIKIFKNENESNCKCIVFINDEATTELNTTIDVTEISNLVIASQTPITTSTTSSKKNTVTTSLSLPFKVCMMSFGAYDYTQEDMKAIYYEGLKYLVNPEPIKKATGVSYYNADVFKDFDVIALNGSLESTRGNKPVALMKTDSSFKVEKARIFKYDPTIQRHVYGAFDDVSNLTHGNHSLLAYNLNLKDKGVISFRFKVEEQTSTPRYILSSYNDDTRKMAILVDSLNDSDQIGCIRFEINGELLDCSETFFYNAWYNVIVFFSKNQVKIYVDGQCIHNENITCDLTNTITYLGSLKEGTSALNGYVEMFAYSNKDVTNKQTLALNIWENGKTISIRKHLDSLGRVKDKTITTNKSNYKTTYVYDKFRVMKELDSDTHSTHYEYDSMGNITKRQDKLQDTIESESSYKYDQLGRLIEEVYPNGDIETFTYDANGNMLTHQIKNEDGNLTTNEKYSYSSIMKDQLVSIQNVLTGSMIKEYKYENSYKGNPTSIITEGVRENLTWEGRKLKQIGTRVHFDYNEDGIRIRKQGVNFVENYILDGSNMIGLRHSSEDESYEMYFNYDEQGELIGLSSEGQEYFYIRDITGNITKIVDESGDVVVKYNYDAWGNFNQIIYRNCLVAHHNPFVYKGYFFDSETGWYYLKSRYYDPTIRRFISADSISYNNPNKLNGLNLFVYCYNNPICYVDYDGHLAFWIVTMAIGAVAYGAYRGIKAYKNGKRGWDVVKEVAIGAVIGGVVGAVAGACVAIGLSASAGASCGAVWNGLKILGCAYSVGGPAAALNFVLNNIYQFTHSGAYLPNYYPPNDGFSGPTTTIELEPGTILIRYGGESGTYVAPLGSNPFELSLPYDKLGTTPNFYMVTQTITVEAGTAESWFYQPGGGIQYILPEAIEKLKEFLEKL